MSDYSNLVEKARAELSDWLKGTPFDQGQPDDHRLFSELCNAVDALQQRVGELERERNRYLDALKACQCDNCKAVEP